jgi:aspartate ammonia-lyase
MQENMPIGGTAVGTGINTHPKFAAKVCAALSKELGATFIEAANHPEAQAAKDSFVEAHGELKTMAIGFGAAMQHLRVFVAGHAARVVDYAGQGQSGDCGVGHPSSLPRDWQRRSRDDVGAGGRWLAI